MLPSRLPNDPDGKNAFTALEPAWVHNLPESGYVREPMLECTALRPDPRVTGPANDAICGIAGSSDHGAGPNLRAFALHLTGPTVSPSIFGTVALLEREVTLKRVGRAREA